MMRNEQPSSAKTDEILGRRDEVWELRVNGDTVREIATKLKVSVGTVHNDLAAVRAEAERAVGASRLDKVAKALLAAIAAPSFDEDGNLDAGALATIANAVARIEERRAKLLGLDAATKTELTGAEGGPLKVDARDHLLAKLSALAIGEPSEDQAPSDTE
jgi:hypothetical protein